MKFVWNESLEQAKGMLQSWNDPPTSGIADVDRDTRMLSLNVLAATGFRRSLGFQSSSEAATDEAENYRNALQTVLENLPLLILFPYRLLQLPVVPKPLARVGKAGADFKNYMIRMFDEEMSALNQGETGSGSIMTSFVRALRAHEKEQELGKSKEGGPAAKGLSKEEVLGNLFTVNFAGHDTTAITFAYSMLLLAAYPEVQDWVGEEVREVTKDLSVEEWSYSDLFPKLKRCRSIMVSLRA